MAKAVVDAAGRVHMLDATGSPVTVEQGEVRGALQAGFQLEAPDAVERRAVQKERGTLGQQALTAGEAALRGATVGLSDAALVGVMGDDYRQAALERQQINPTISTVGEVGGAIAPALFSGGESLFARGLEGIGAPTRAVSAVGRGVEGATLATLKALGYEEASALGRIAAKSTALGAAGAAEGALYGLGQSVSESALGGTDWTAEKALAAMKEGGLYGLAGGAGIGALGSAASSAGRAVVERMTGGQPLREALSDFAEKRAFKAATGNAKKFYDRATNFGENPERLNRIGRKLLDRDVPLSGNIDEIEHAVSAHVDDAASRLQAVAKQLDESGVKVDTKSVLQKVDEQIGKLRDQKLGSYDAIADRLEKEIAPFRQAVEGTPGVFHVKPGAEVREGFLQGARTRTPVGGKEYGFSEFWKFRQRIDDLINFEKKARGPAEDALRDMRSVFDDAVTATVESGADEAATKLAMAGDTKAAEAYSGLSKSWKAAKEDYSDFILAKDAVREQAERMEKNRWVSASDYGVGTGFALLSAVTSGGTGALGAMALGGLSSMAHKYVRERGAGTVARLADRLSQLEARTNTAAKVLAGIEKAPRLAARGVAMVGVDPADYDDVRKKVEDFAANPQGATLELAKTLEPLAKTQPELATAMGVRITQDMQYLAAQAPLVMSRAGASLTPTVEKPMVSAVQKVGLVRKAAALADPERVVRDLAQGKIDLDGIEALKARRPELFQDLRVKVATYAASRGESLPYHRRILLSLAFDFRGDESLNPQTLAAIQQTSAPVQEEQQAPPGGSFKSDGEIAASTQTPSQEAINL